MTPVPVRSGDGRRGRRPRPAAAAVLAVLTAFGACSSASPERPPAPAPAPVVTVTMLDHRFELDRSVPSGRVVFRIRNSGQEAHHLTMLPLPEDLPPIAEQLRGSQRRVVEPYAGIYDREPGDTGTFAVDLAPGRRYGLICAVRDEDDQPHWMKGMATEFRTAGTPAEGPTPTSVTTTTPADGETPATGTTPSPPPPGAGE